MQEMKKFLVFFDWNKATLTPEARRIIATAAEDFKKTGSTRIVATGLPTRRARPRTTCACRCAVPKP